MSHQCTVGVLDVAVGNIGSVVSMYRKLGIRTLLVSSASELSQCDRFILPGVGSFDNGMYRLRNSGLIPALEELVLGEHRPVLGICLGMQMLADRSEEGAGSESGLGWIQGSVRHLARLSGVGVRVPQMGWAYVKPRGDSTLFARSGATEPPRFYFSHSYALVPADADVIEATVDYGQPVCAAVRSGNVAGVQFHPEKSHRFGMELLRRFGQEEPML